jgi:hypothetical protein
MNDYDNYLVLYLIPPELYRDNNVLNLQWDSIKTLIPCLLRSLYSGSIRVKLHDFERTLTGLINADRTAKINILGRTATMWYYLTEVFQQSLGPRKGIFAEELIARWIEDYNKNSCKGFKIIKIDGKSHSLILGKVLSQHYKISSSSKKQIDFVIKSKGRVDFIELRMSEHTGGRTAQESLLDKHEELLGMLESKGLREALLSKGINEMNLVIGILFNEDHELIVGKNYNVGRLNSLINYIMEDNHVWGKVNDLANKKYVDCNGNKISKSTFKDELESKHEACIKTNNGNFTIRFKILLGDEFFEEYMCKHFNDIKNEWLNMIADDIWLFYTLLINEIKVAREFNQTNVRKIYDLLPKNQGILSDFMNLYYNKNMDINEYRDKLNKLAEQCASEVLKITTSRGIELRVLESNDATAIFEYLKQLCLAVFAIYLTINIKKDPNFSECEWENTISQSQLITT